MKAVKLSLYILSGLIATSTITRLAVEIDTVQVLVWGGVLVWAWSISDFGHEVFKRIFRLDDAELGTLRAVVGIVFIVGILVNWSFEGFPQWMQILF